MQCKTKKICSERGWMREVNLQRNLSRSKVTVLINRIHYSLLFHLWFSWLLCLHFSSLYSLHYLIQWTINLLHSQMFTVDEHYKEHRVASLCVSMCVHLSKHLLPQLMV